MLTLESQFIKRLNNSLNKSALVKVAESIFKIVRLAVGYLNCSLPESLLVS